MAYIANNMDPDQTPAADIVSRQHFYENHSLQHFSLNPLTRLTMCARIHGQYFIESMNKTQYSMNNMY